MRLGRLLLAGLTALAAYCCAQTAPPPDAHHAMRVWRAVVPILVHAAEAVSSAPAVTYAAHSFLALKALAAARLSGSLVLVASLAAVNRIERQHQRSLLRC
ncbi:MAG TPA: hypothetical protein VKX39_08685 [Bryobacteraceae bacterium]|jgi:hypothetical protein|nr:hypothetical protein [Bryobacteraceae bacterium]